MATNVIGIGDAVVVGCGGCCTADAVDIAVLPTTCSRRAMW